jgi:hypothetical protein
MGPSPAFKSCMCVVAVIDDDPAKSSKPGVGEVSLSLEKPEGNQKAR